MPTAHDHPLLDIRLQRESPTAGFDARFPNTNQTKNCWQNYVDYFKCVAAKGDGFVPCQQFKKTYTSLCPIKWVETWDEQREEGVFPALAAKPSGHH
ncbi:Cytochrome c oxidase subunit 6B [Cladochytrium tenue]|nr:Cytochrome c oxidase subunit 6B [Cladochytrium tenue]